MGDARNSEISYDTGDSRVLTVGWSNWSQQLAREIYENSDEYDLQLHQFCDIREFEDIENDPNIDFKPSDVGLTEENYVRIDPDRPLTDYNLEADAVYVANHIQNHLEHTEQAHEIVERSRETPGGAVITEKGIEPFYNEYDFDHSHIGPSGITHSELVHYMLKEQSIDIMQRLPSLTDEHGDIEYLDIALTESREIVDEDKNHMILPENGGNVKDFLKHAVEVAVANTDAELGTLREAEGFTNYLALSDEHPTTTYASWDLEGENFAEDAYTEMTVGKGFDETRKIMTVGFEDGHEVDVNWMSSGEEDVPPQKWYAHIIESMIPNGVEPFMGREEREMIDKPLDEVNERIGVKVPRPAEEYRDEVVAALNDD